MREAGEGVFRRGGVESCVWVGLVEVWGEGFRGVVGEWTFRRDTAGDCGKGYRRTRREQKQEVILSHGK